MSISRRIIDVVQDGGLVNDGDLVLDGDAVQDGDVMLHGDPVQDRCCDFRFATSGLYLMRSECRNSALADLPLQW